METKPELSDKKRLRLAISSLHIDVQHAKWIHELLADARPSVLSELECIIKKKLEKAATGKLMDFIAALFPDQIQSKLMTFAREELLHREQKGDKED
jgi:formate dehydrogenase maturation protein FdhE